MAERYDQAIRRLVRGLRSARQMFAALIVAGGQVNITEGPQQVNVDARSQTKSKKRGSDGSAVS